MKLKPKIIFGLLMILVEEVTKSPNINAKLEIAFSLLCFCDIQKGINTKLNNYKTDMPRSCGRRGESRMCSSNTPLRSQSGYMLRVNYQPSKLRMRVRISLPASGLLNNLPSKPFS